VTARFAYAALFTILLPLLLAAWATRMSSLLPRLMAPAPSVSWAGWLLLGLGLTLILWAMAALWIHGRGVPMNAFPPPQLVEGGPYSLLPHPIYVGFSAMCFGVSIVACSPGGLWVVAPSATLAALALGVGHETPDLQRRFGRAPRSALGRGVRWLMNWLRPPWRGVLRWAELLANSWREWRIGPVRVINHGLYAALAAAVGAAIAGALAGNRALPDLTILAVASLLGAALWGQYWVGSKSLLRPFGYFGSALAILIVVPALALAGRSGSELWPLAAATAVAAPWVQLLGRLRCLVQGCCHGAPLPAASADDEPLGIVYRHPRSRVCWVSHLGGIPLHATPVYSMASNLLIGVAMALLWLLASPTSLILGAYLLLAGVSRFIEESRRGEVTTPVRGGLRLYQWFAVASTLLGAAITCATSPAAPPAAGVTAPVVLVALGVGLLHGLAMGVDFPRSNRRFSRLV